MPIIRLHNIKGGKEFALSTDVIAEVHAVTEVSPNNPGLPVPHSKIFLQPDGPDNGSTYTVSQTYNEVMALIVNAECKVYPPPGSMILHPRVFRDGDQWSALYGDNLQEGIAGFGSTPAAAIADFDQEFKERDAKRLHGLEVKGEGREVTVKPEETPDPFVDGSLGTQSHDLGTCDGLPRVTLWQGNEEHIINLATTTEDGSCTGVTSLGITQSRALWRFLTDFFSK